MLFLERAGFDVVVGMRRGERHMFRRPVSRARSETGVLTRRGERCILQRALGKGDPWGKHQSHYCETVRRRVQERAKDRTFNNGRYGLRF